MILKWLSPEGNWHWFDRIDNLTHHGYLTVEEAQRLAEIYDGKDTRLVYMRDASAYGLETDENYRADYVTIKRDGERKHLWLHSLQVYVMSDTGQTIDKFYH